MDRDLMKKTAIAALLAFAGLGLTAHSSANAAVLVPSKGAAVGTADALVTHVRRGGGSHSGGSRASGGSRSFSSSGSRSFSSGGGRSSGSASRSFRSGGSAVRSGRSSSFRGAPAVRGSSQFRGERSTFRSNSTLRRDSAVRSGRTVHRRGYRPPGAQRWHPRHHAHRKWHRRPYYGYVIGGVTIGAILAASAYYAYADEPPADGLCWYWADPSETRGYWDYCDDPY